MYYICHLSHSIKARRNIFLLVYVGLLILSLLLIILDSNGFTKCRLYRLEKENANNHESTLPSYFRSKILLLREQPLELM